MPALTKIGRQFARVRGTRAAGQELPAVLDPQLRGRHRRGSLAGHGRRSLYSYISRGISGQFIV
jgi:hypothetical protein